MESLLDRDHARIRGLEDRYIFKEIKGGLAHFPTWLLLVGYLVYWVELYALNQKNGLTSPLAVVLVLVIFVVLCSTAGALKASLQTFWQNFSALDRLTKIMVAVGLVISVIILVCGLYASFFPPHLVQEYDLLYYRITVPRQHLILGTFSHIPWSAADFFYMPVDFALTPFWLVTTWPNKFPQFIFILGLLAVVVKLVKHLGGNWLAQITAAFCVLGSHNVGIQVGTGMLDLVGCYLILAAFHSLLEKNAFLCAAELAFYVWSKSFIPPTIVLIIIFMAVICVVMRLGGPLKCGWVLPETGFLQWKEWGPFFKKTAGLFVLLSCVVGGPFVGKSVYYTGTPAYPFGVGIFSLHGQAQGPVVSVLEQKAHDLAAVRDAYGYGRSPEAFIKHFWLIAVPTQGVNNGYDYPVGLIYVLCAVPFAVLLARAFIRREFLVFPVFAAGFWAVWWMTSQQTRFLYVPLILIVIILAASKKIAGRVFLSCVLLALVSTSLSVARAHKVDWGRSAYDVIRERDKKLMAMSDIYNGVDPLIVDDADVAFADFPVEVKNKSILVFK